MSSLLSVMLAASISSSSNGWVKQETLNTFNDVAVTIEQHDKIVAETGSAPFWGGQGPNAVLRAWNSAAFDPQNRVFYFIGGGHSDYGGNEVYTYALDSQVWQRITDPAPLLKYEPHSVKPSVDVYVPLDSPLSPHTWDGLTWNPATKSFWLATPKGFGGPGGKPEHVPEGKFVWEFVPATRSWNKYPATLTYTRPTSVYIPETEQMLFVHHDGSNGRHAFLYDKNGAETDLGYIENLDAMGVATMFRNPATGQLYSAHIEGIYEINLVNNRITAKKVFDFPTLESLHLARHLGQASYNYRPVDGKFYIWNGGRELLTWNPSNNDFEVIWNDGNLPAPSQNAKGFNKVFDKFVYIPEKDHFVGVQYGADGMGSDGIWIWKPTGNPSDIDMLNVAQTELDGTTQTSASFFMPIASGDKNFNAKVTTFYRKSGTNNWQQGMDLFRVRPDLVQNTKNNTGLSPNGFSGMVTGLEPDTSYEFKFMATDPDGMNSASEYLLSTKTKAFAQAVSSAQIITVNNQTELQAAVDTAQPGQIIQLAAGTYAPVRLDNNGTVDAPIVIQGQENFSAIIDGLTDTAALDIRADHVIVKNLHLTNAKHGIRFLHSRTGVTLENNLITNIDKGIVAKGGHTDVHIFNNMLQGNNVQGDVSNATWSDEGIVVTGQNIEISNNTLAGFGDSIGLHWSSDIANKAINIHHNLIKWGGDDGIEFDFTLRNVAAHHNMVTNTANGLSFQPVWGGPAIAFRNVVVNTSRGPLKIKPEKDDPSGILVYHNTFVKTHATGEKGEAWKNASGTPSKLDVKNNLFMSATSTTGYVLKNASKHHYLTMSHNAWSVDGEFEMKLAGNKQDIWARSFSQWKAETPFGSFDQLVDSSTVFAADFTFAANLEAETFANYQAPESINVALSAGSNAVDTGTVINGFATKIQGSAPDIGAMELGSEQPVFGVNNNILKDAAPDNGDLNNSTAPTEPDLIVEGTDKRDVLNQSASEVAVKILGFDGHDTLTGSANADVLVGGPGSDTMYGKAGDDIFRVAEQDTGFDSIHGDDGCDTVLGDETDNVFRIRKLTSIEKFNGGEGYDIILGNDYRQVIDFSQTEVTSIEFIDLADGHDSIIASVGDDNIHVGSGDDFVDGNTGTDTLYYNGNYSEYTLNKTFNGTLKIISANDGKDKVVNVEFIQFNDVLITVADL